MNTQRLGQVRRLFGWDGSQLEAELAERAAYVEKMVESRLFTLNDVGDSIRKFYINKYGLA